MDVNKSHISKAYGEKMHTKVIFVDNIVYRWWRKESQTFSEITLYNLLWRPKCSMCPHYVCWCNYEKKAVKNPILQITSQGMITSSRYKRWWIFFREVYFANCLGGELVLYICKILLVNKHSDGFIKQDVGFWLFFNKRWHFMR